MKASTLDLPNAAASSATLKWFSVALANCSFAVSTTSGAGRALAAVLVFSMVITRSFMKVWCNRENNPDLDYVAAQHDYRSAQVALSRRLTGRSIRATFFWTRESPTRIDDSV